MPNENDTLTPHRKRKVRAFLKDFDDATPEAGAFWAVLFRHEVVAHAVAVEAAQELETSDRTVGDVLEGWRPRALVPRSERKNWHADGCPGADACNCGGGLTDAELFAKVRP